MKLMEAVPLDQKEHFENLGILFIDPDMADEISAAMDTLEGCTVHQCHLSESYCPHCTDKTKCSVKLRRDLCRI